MIKRELRKYDVVAIQPSLVMLVPAATFHALLAASLPFSHFVISQLNDRMGEFIASIQNHRLLDADARVAQSLAQLFNPQLYPSTDLTLTISQEELGYLTGLSRQRVNQALQALTDQGVLALAYNQIKVLDLDRLRRYGLDQLWGRRGWAPALSRPLSATAPAHGARYGGIARPWRPAAIRAAATGTARRWPVRIPSTSRGAARGPWA